MISSLIDCCVSGVQIHNFPDVCNSHNWFRCEGHAKSIAGSGRSGGSGQRKSKRGRDAVHHSGVLQVSVHGVSCCHIAFKSSGKALNYFFGIDQCARLSDMDRIPECGYIASEMQVDMIPQAIGVVLFHSGNSCSDIVCLSLETVTWPLPDIRIHESASHTISTTVRIIFPISRILLSLAMKPIAASHSFFSVAGSLFLKDQR
jgi:hypothetical protein